MTEDMERSCDDGVLRNMTAQERAGYAQTLLRLGLRNNGLGYMLPAAFGESNTKNVFPIFLASVSLPAGCVPQRCFLWRRRA